MPDSKPHPVGLLLFILVAIMAGLALGRWLTDEYAPPVSGYTGER